MDAYALKHIYRVLLTVLHMKTFKNFFTESILDPEKAELSPQVFSADQETLRDDARTQLLAGISKLSKEMNIIDYTLIGSILTRRYAQDSDVDINILISAKDEDMEELRKIAVDASGKFVSGSHHPINYHVLNDKSDFENANDSADGVFDISNNKFIRKPIEKAFHISQYMSKFKTLVSKIDYLKDELKDDLMDYSELKKLSKEHATELMHEIEKELKEIEASAEGLIDLYDKVRKDRADGFARPLTAQEIKDYGAKNRLPGNVIYKLLERHHYLHFLGKVKEIVGDDGKVSPDEADELSKLTAKQ